MTQPKAIQPVTQVQNKAPGSEKEEPEPGYVSLGRAAFRVLKKLNEDKEFKAAANKVFRDVERDLEVTGRKLIEVTADPARRKDFFNEIGKRLFGDDKEGDS